METTQNLTGDGAAASDLAGLLSDTTFVRFVVAATGDAIAATGLFGRSLTTVGVPFHVSVTPTVYHANQRLSPTTTSADGVTVTIGVEGTNNGSTEAVKPTETPASVIAFNVATELGTDPNPILALAGVVAANHQPDDYPSLLDAAGDALWRRPGVCSPTADVTDGLAHTTYAHSSFSGDTSATSAVVSSLVDDDPQTIASLLVLDTIGTAGTTPRSGVAIERAVRPYGTENDVFETVEGYADVLDVCSQSCPATALGLALGHDSERDAALEAWRDGSRAAHEAMTTAKTERYDGLFVAFVDEGPLETTARLFRDFRSPEPITLVIGDGEAGVTSTPDYELRSLVSAAASAVDATTRIDRCRAFVRFDCDRTALRSAFAEGME